MRQFKEFRMPPITMGRDNTIVGVRDHDIPGSDAQSEMLKKAKDKIKKKLTIKMPKFKVKMKTPAKLKAFMEKDKVKEGKITWQRGTLSDGTMQIGIFDKDKEKALEAARELIIFLRKNKRTKIGGDKEDSDGQPNEAIAKYSEELSKLIFDDELLDDLEPDGNNADQSANDIVLNRLKDLGVNIR